MAKTWDYIIIGSGFGGSVSALRLVEKGYDVLMLEKGRRFAPEDFPKTNWDLKRWMWQPSLGWRGLFKMTFFPHVTIVSGVGVGGGSLVYANTLPIPKQEFFEAPSWGGLADWQPELAPHYQTARKMLGATTNPMLGYPDEVLRQVAADHNDEKNVSPTTVAVYFGEPGRTVPDPYFEGRGPARTGCTGCGACMLGCRVGAKNTLDKNYLYLAEKRGLEIRADTEVTWVSPGSEGGYEVTAVTSQGRRKAKNTFPARNVIFAGGVLGTVDLLLRLKESPAGLPQLSDTLGQAVRTNSEALLGVVSQRRDVDMSKGIAISSIWETDPHSHVEPVRYPAGSGFFRLMQAPHVAGSGAPVRIARAIWAVARHPIRLTRAFLVPDWAKHTMILLYMRTLEGTLRFRRGRAWTSLFRRGMTTAIEGGEAPKASIPEASQIAEAVAKKIDGTPMSLVNETLLDVPTTAHILGGCCMGKSADTGVIDAQHRVFGYDGLYVIDGSAVSANPGVNPSLTIAALAERAMTFIPNKDSARHEKQAAG